MSSKFLTLIESPKIAENPKIDSEVEDSSSSIYYIIGALIAIIFIIFALSGKKKPTTPKNTYTKNTKRSEKELKEELVKNIIKNIKIEVTTSSSNSSYKDDSIIDVTGESYRINTTSNLKKYSNGVAYWAHHYVYSYSEINGATSEQKKFYEFFKNSFLNGEYFDLEGNTNYAFILLFDLLNEYENHRDILS